MPAEQQLLNVIVKIIKKGCNEIFGTTTFHGPFCCCFFFFFIFYSLEAKYSFETLHVSLNFLRIFQNLSRIVFSRRGSNCH